MAVESRFVVIRQGVEVETFMDKKAADEYDKMLDMADSLAEMFEASSFNIDEKVREELCIYLAKNREDVLVALQAKKAKPETAAKKNVTAPVETANSTDSSPEIEATAKVKAPRKAKASTSK
ncbi:YebG family protein [Colwellia sp. BRX8-7]|jgi:dsDNA-binding SOS-regulon protein|uniref:YebG family protein n=1 Tax=Colwellia sp. BRX8-7 TaxID=2759833 RepID=UPI0015F4D3C8|nr:YebG family protein [Colwellia sp. BRX8-7]MBA6335966.1 YebG family protein [Colwellia sp. BRX8-7]